MKLIYIFKTFLGEEHKGNNIIIYWAAHDEKINVNFILFVQNTYGNKYVVKYYNKSVNFRETCDL